MILTESFNMFPLAILPDSINALRRVSESASNVTWLISWYSVVSGEKNTGFFPALDIATHTALASWVSVPS